MLPFKNIGVAIIAPRVGMCYANEVSLKNEVDKSERFPLILFYRPTEPLIGFQ